VRESLVSSSSAPPPAAKPAPPPAPTTGGGRAGDTRVCQLCGRPGHLASKCHRRFQRSFLGIGNNGQGNERQAQLADFGPPTAAPAAFAATKGKEHVQGSTPSYPIDPAWYMDTGATDHLTSELQKLTTHQPYYGHDKVHTANGAGMPISHIGQASLLTSLPSRQLHLRNVLRVPSVTRNLLSVQNSLLIIMSYVNFTRLIFLLRIEPPGTFCLVVASAKGCTAWRILLSLVSSAGFEYHHHSGTLALVILPLP
jgi:hypothetical protein